MAKFAFVFVTLCAVQSAFSGIIKYKPEFNLWDIVPAGLTYQMDYLKNAQNNKNTYVIKNGECDQVFFLQLELTEVCSSGGTRLYFSPFDTEIRGCYTIGTGNTETFADCCQLRYSPVNGAEPGTIYYKEFCSGRREKGRYMNPYELGKYGIDRNIKDLRLVENTRDLHEVCNRNYDSGRCREAKALEKEIKEADVYWYDALSIWRYPNDITKVRRNVDGKTTEIKESIEGF